MNAATAMAHPNVALVKYWGKRDLALNLPEAGSISLTLAGLETRTTVEQDEGLDDDQVVIDGEEAEGRAAERVSDVLDLLRARVGERVPLRVISRSNFPAAAGLASSASAFAALVAAGSRALGLELGQSELSILARRGSGSAARSIYGGFVEMQRGERGDGIDSRAFPLAAASGWDVEMVVAVVGAGPKPIGSTDAMERSRKTSPLHAGWIASVERDLPEARAAIGAGDLETLGCVMERSCLAMHADCLAADPGIMYWHPATVALFHRVRELRASGIPAFFTNDAGPHVKALCSADDAAAVAAALGEVAGVTRVHRAPPGEGIQWVT